MGTPSLGFPGGGSHCLSGTGNTMRGTRDTDLGGVMTSPKDEAGSKKAPLRFVPPSLVIAASGPLASGAEKYGAYNWRAERIILSTHLEAAFRHLLAYQDGENCDPETGYSHLAHAAATLAVILDADACGTMHDDRHKGPANHLLEIHRKTRDSAYEAPPIPVRFRKSTVTVGFQEPQNISEVGVKVPAPESKLPLVIDWSADD